MLKRGQKTAITEQAATDSASPDARAGAGAGAAHGAQAGPPPLPPIVLQHFAATSPTVSWRHPLAKGMRAWRRVSRCMTAALLVVPCDSVQMQAANLTTHAVQGIPSVIVTDVDGAALRREQAEGKRHNEVWVNFPDSPRASTVTHKPGDPRAAIAPLLAARALGGNFSWLLFGDVRRCAASCRTVHA